MKTITLFAAAILFLTCGKPGGSPIDPVHRLTAHPLMVKPLAERIGAPPKNVLAYLGDLDKRNDYTGYIPTTQEHELIVRSLKSLPPKLLEVMEKRCAGIYFLNDFATTGLTDWVLDEKGRVYCYMAFRKSALNGGASQIITDREKTAFINDDATVGIELSLVPDLPGFQYILLHESVHAYDYVTGITPFVEPDLPYKKENHSAPPYEGSIWNDYAVTKTPYSFREKLSFYGFGKGPALKISRAKEVYEEFMPSPFMTLYGSHNWAEDVAEVLAFYHMTEKLKADYGIRVTSKGNTVASWKPLAKAEKRKRFENLEQYYR